MSAGTISVVPITPELRPLLTDRERKTADLYPTSVVVGRFGDRRPAVLASGRDRVRLSGVAWELALTYGAAHLVMPPVVVPQPRVGDKDACRECRADVVLTVAEVSGRRVPYWVHVEPAPYGDRSAHAARVGVA